MAEKEKKLIYRVIQDDILEKIEQGVYKNGCMLPGENKLAEVYSTSVPTVRKALGELVYQNVIFRIKGKGTFVVDKSVEQSTLGDDECLSEQKEKHNTRICFLVLADASDSSIMKMIRGAQAYLLSRGYTMNILCGEETMEDELDLIQECINRKMEGVIWFSVAPEGNLEGLKLLRQNNIPMVMLDRGPTQMPYTLVSAYNLDGGYQMAKYLLELGHRKILFAADQIDLVAEKERIKGYKLALAEIGVTYEEKLVISNCIQDTDKAIEVIRDRDITAVQCANDKVASQIIRRLEQIGYRVPEDISVGGFDNAMETEYSHPRITSINQPFEDMGQVAAKKLLELLNGKALNSQTWLPMELVVKESTCAPKK